MNEVNYSMSWYLLVSSKPPQFLPLAKFSSDYYKRCSSSLSSKPVSDSKYIINSKFCYFLWNAVGEGWHILMLVLFSIWKWQGILIHAFVVSKIDSYNSLIFGLPKHLIDKLQHLLNAAARLIMVANKYDSITPILKELHWLPIEQRIIFNINLITFKCLNNLAPSYLKELLTLYRPNRSLRSSSDNLKLVTVPYNLKTYGYMAPILWNSLPFHIRSADSINSFKSKLKTYLFKSAYNL